MRCLPPRQAGLLALPPQARDAKALAHSARSLSNQGTASRVLDGLPFRGQVCACCNRCDGD
eukprot:301113-Alexandrium_andersonii.AAC.1